VTSLAWEPLHAGEACERLASSSKDGTVRIWNVRTGKCLAELAQHTGSVECCKWGGEGLLYTASRDRTIKVRGCWGFDLFWGGDRGYMCALIVWFAYDGPLDWSSSSPSG
jgi:WD40 repeat protein